MPIMASPNLEADSVVEKCPVSGDAPISTERSTMEPVLTNDASALINKEAPVNEPVNGTKHSVPNDPSLTRERIIEAASCLTTDDLHDLYLKKLKALEGPQTETTSRRSSKLVGSIIDYVGVLEERIERLEDTKAAKDKSGEHPDANSEKDRKASSDAATGDQAEKGKDQESFSSEIKFFHSATEFNRQGKHAPDKTKPNTFSCDSDSQHFIRALYNLTDDNSHSQTPENYQPDPGKVDIIALRLHSVPVSDFLKSRANLTSTLFPSIQMKKPFRPLLQNYDKIKEQLEKLDQRYNLPQIESKTKPAATPSADTPSFPESAKYEEPEALGHFQTLVSFIGKYLHKQISHLERIRKGEDDKITFDNLWMLFEPGTVIYCPSRGEKQIKDYRNEPLFVPQAFQVFGAFGGMPSTSSFAPTTEGSSNMKRDVVDSGTPSESQADSTIVDHLPKPANNLFSPLYTWCFTVDFDGIIYGMIDHIFIFKHFHGQVDIQSLEAYPVRFHRSSGGQDLMAGLSTRGHTFLSTTLVSHLAYEGLTVGTSREEVESDVIVDFKLAYTETHQGSRMSNLGGPMFLSLEDLLPDSTVEGLSELATHKCDVSECTIPNCGQDAYSVFQKAQANKIKKDVGLQLEEYEWSDVSRKERLELFIEYMKGLGLLQLLPGVVPGFALRNKTWVLLDINLLKEPEKLDEWDQLVLPDGHRQMVQAMVETYAKGSHDSSSASKSQYTNPGMDIVRGKGKGCIILLHGVPGVGKTSTAECVAAYTGRPLYPITCGDIGYSPETVEANMEKHFRLAHKWGCVLLLDEADVFLAKRNKADVKRNGLVSVFLRIMEYYSGILFLTTNRVGAIDDAFRSRLHLTLFYPKLTKAQTKRIWRNNMKRLKDINEKRKGGQAPIIDFDKAKILQWVDLNWELLQWNGRQIRNAFQTALALTEFEAKHSKTPEAERTLQVTHFCTIADATLWFNEYLIATHGADEDETARRDKLRTEGFIPRMKVKQLPSSSSDDSEDGSDESESNDSEESGSEIRKKQKKDKAKRKKKENRERKAKRDEERNKSTRKEKKSSKQLSKSDSEEEDESEHSDKEVNGKRERRKSNR